MKKEREAEDEYFVKLHEKEKEMASVHSCGDSFSGKFDGRGGPDQTMSDCTMDDDTKLGLRSCHTTGSQGVNPAVETGGRSRESCQTISTSALGGDGDMADNRHSWQEGSGSPPPTNLQAQLPHHEKAGQRSPSLASTESWEA